MIAFAEMTGEMYPVGDSGYDHYQRNNTSKSFGPNTYEAYIPWRTLYKYVKAANDVIGAIDVESSSEVQLAYLGMAYAYRACSPACTSR